MENQLEKPKDILTVPEAIELINTDTRTNPVVDDKYLITRVEYLKLNWRGGGTNFTIPLVKYNKDKTKVIPNGVKWAAITSEREMRDLYYAITDHYKALSGRDVDPSEIGLMKQTTVINKQDSAASTGRPQANKSSKLKKGDKMKSGAETVGDY